MQWGQIKTLFILCFLVLNIYLIYQFLEKQNEADLRVKEAPDASIETRLKNEDIKIGDLPDEEIRESFISVKQEKFTEENKKDIKSLQNQESVVIEDKLVLSKFEKPIKVPDNAKDTEIATTVKQYVLDGNDYTFWDWNKELNVLILFQKKSGQPVFFNQSGLLLVYLNDKNEMSFYTQTRLSEPDGKNTDKKKLIKAIRAVETLFKSNKLQSGDKVTKANIGFFTRVPFDNGVQVFVPTWKITVNDERNYFVNALEGYSFPSEDIEFLQTVLSSTKEKVELLDDDVKMKASVLKELTEKLEISKRGEGE